MKRNIVRYILCLLFVIPMTGCEDFLTQVNPNEISTDNYWRNLRECESGLIAVYNQLRNTGMMAVGAETNRSDLAYPGYGRPNATNEYYLQTFTDGSAAVNGKWDALYKGIFRANQVIRGLNGIEDDMITDDDVEKWHILMAEARFFRGLFHFYAHSTFNFGKIIIYDFVPEEEKEFYQPLSSSEDVKAFFRADLEYAREYLPLYRTEYKDDGTPSDPQMAGRIAKGAATSILGTSYLYEEDFDKAAKYFEEVLESGVYQLAHVSENSTSHGEFNQESILEIAYDLTYKIEESPWSPKSTKNTYAAEFSPVGGWRASLPSCWLIMAFREDAPDPTDSRNIITYMGEDPSTGEPIELNRVRDYSLRTSYSLALVDDRDLPYYNATTAQAAGFNNLETGYFRKFTNWDITENETSLNQQSGINYRLLRLADIYLMYAEALIKGGNGGDVAKAIEYINEVRYRSALILLGTAPDVNHPGSSFDGITYNAKSLMDHLMYKERPLELCLEGYAIRQIDMRRWGITKRRFEDLSKQIYHGENYEFIDQDGAVQTRWGSVLTEGPNSGFPEKNMIDFQEAATNYNERMHSYFPIPNSETTANPNL
ncbi:RagB/SusD family nutrient uptake outer membrane protein [Persicobacter psychrovividus]|uniref:Membrane protein n=1 Tax=Persicobacter psychrovividus TaxID=387638 RepID=A0ABM7VMX9_9BACT|nr:membrane protein [Persicobacter psychrovividus]